MIIWSKNHQIIKTWFADGSWSESLSVRGPGRLSGLTGFKCHCCLRVTEPESLRARVSRPAVPVSLARGCLTVSEGPPLQVRCSRSGCLIFKLASRSESRRVWVTCRLNLSCQKGHSIWNLGSLRLYSTFFNLGYIAPAKLLYSTGAISIFCYIATCYIAILWRKVVHSNMLYTVPAI